MFVVLCRTPCRCSCSSPSYCVMCGELLRRPLRPREGGVTFADGLSLLCVMYFFSVCFRLLPQRQKSFERESLDNKNFFFFFADADHQTSGRDAHTKRRLHSQLSEIDFFFSFSFSLLLTFVGNSPLLHPIYKARGKQCGGCSSASLRFRWVTLLSHCQKRIPHMSS